MSTIIEKEDKKTYSTNQIEYIRICRALAALAVVLFHCSTNMQYDFILQKFVTTYTNWCVPMFVTITGALFLNQNKPISPERMIKKNVTKILLVIFFWGGVYDLISTVIINRCFNLQTIITVLKMVVLADTSFCYQFWYLYMLIGLYLFIPIIKPWINDSFYNKNTEWGWKVCFCSGF